MIKKIIKKSFIFKIYMEYKLHLFQNKWRKINDNNYTTANNMFNPELVSIGKASYGELNIVSFADISHLIIGNFVSIAQEVVFILNAEHYINHFSTYPFKVKYLQTAKEESFGKGDIIVEDDTWIGYRATIMSGVHIGKGAVIAAGSVVTKDVPPYAVVAGIPAKVIKYRFDEDVRNSLMLFNFNNINKSFIQKNIDLFYQPIIGENQIKTICDLLKDDNLNF